VETFEPDMSNILAGASIMYVTDMVGVFEKVINGDDLLKHFKIKFAYLTKKYKNNQKALEVLDQLQAKYKDVNTIAKSVAKEIYPLHYFF
jgi:hypothetical protein